MASPTASPPWSPPASRQIVLGLDPDPSAALAGRRRRDPGTGTPRSARRRPSPRTARRSSTRPAPACVAVKPQLACFERLGAPGWTRARRPPSPHARAAGLLVLADAKRGDIDVSAAAYAQALLGATPTPFGDVDGPRRRRDHRQPVPGRATRSSRSSTPPARRAPGCSSSSAPRTPARRTSRTCRLGDGERVWERARRDRRRARRRRGASGARRTSAPSSARPRPSTSRALRELMPRAPFLLPGIGAQGGRVEDLAPAFAPGRAGGLVTASRSIAARARDAIRRARPADGGARGGRAPARAAPGRWRDATAPPSPDRMLRA